MSQSPMAVVDTSFWSLACIVGLEPHLWRRWPVIAVPTVVQNELFHQVKNVPQQQLFQHHLTQGHLVIRDPQVFISTLSKGERAVVSLAIELNVPALLDDYRPHLHARQLRVNAMSVAQVLIALLYQGMLRRNEAEQIFRQLAQTHATSPIFLQWAAQQLQAQGGTISWP